MRKEIIFFICVINNFNVIVFKNMVKKLLVFMMIYIMSNNCNYNYKNNFNLNKVW